MIPEFGPFSLVGDFDADYQAYPPRTTNDNWQWSAEVCQSPADGCLEEINISISGNPLRSGVNEGLLWTPPGEVSAVVQKMKQANVTRVRVAVYWCAIEPDAPNGSTHTYNWSMLDSVAAKLRTANIRMFAVLIGTPAWASGQTCPPGEPCCHCNVPPTAEHDDASYVVAPYVQQPNWLELLYNVQDVPGFDFLRHADAVNIHPYVPYTPPNTLGIIQAHINETRSVMSSHGDSRPLWITELGWPVHLNPGNPPRWYVTEAEQQLLLSQVKCGI